MSLSILNDILVTGENVEEHLENLCQVPFRVQKAGMHQKRAECSFMLFEVTYLGHVISQTSIHPAAEKVRSLCDAAVPTNVSQLKSFLGLINFHPCFLPNLSTLHAPLHTLRQKDMPWDHHNRKLSTLPRTLSHPHPLLLTTALTNH